jgi:cytoskeletal protein CcmA (bactofilin family)
MAEKTFEMNTILGENSTYEGTLNVKGSLRIEGNFNGEINADSLVIGKKAKVHADIKAPSIIVGGVVEGNISDNKQLTLQSTGRIVGDVQTEKLSVEEGAVLHGKCNMTAK